MEEWIREYYDERWGQKLLIGKGGFIVYSIRGTQFYFNEFHIGQKFRKSLDAFVELMDSARKIAFDAGCLTLGAHVPLNAHNATQVVRNNLKYGFRIVGHDANGLGMIKELILHG